MTFAAILIFAPRIDGPPHVVCGALPAQLPTLPVLLHRFNVDKQCNVRTPSTTMTMAPPSLLPSGNDRASPAALQRLALGVLAALDAV